MVKTTRKQREALLKIYHRKCDNNWQETMSYKEFRKTVTPGLGYIMVPWCGMWLGIEPDGYTHS